MKSSLALWLVTAFGATACGGHHRSSAGNTPEAKASEHAQNYQDFLRLWQASQAQETLTGADNLGPCSDCFFSNGATVSASATQCADPLGEDCRFYTDCVERDCLNADTVPPSLDDCVESCLPLHDVTCHSQWDAYVACMVTACTAVCQ